MRAGSAPLSAAKLGHPPTLPGGGAELGEEGGPWGYPWVLHPKRVRCDPQAKGALLVNP